LGEKKGAWESWGGRNRGGGVTTSSVDQKLPCRLPGAQKCHTEERNSSLIFVGCSDESKEGLVRGREEGACRYKMILGEYKNSEFVV